MNSHIMELESIRATVDLYTEGFHTGNTDLMKKAFHPKAMMFGTSPGHVTIVEIEGLYSYIASKKPLSETGEAHYAVITDIRYAGHAATVEMVETAAHGTDYTNYFQLLKIEGQWLIVSKTFNATASA